MGVLEQALGWLPLGLGLVMEAELSYIHICILAMCTNVCVGNAITCRQNLLNVYRVISEFNRD